MTEPREALFHHARIWLAKRLLPKGWHVARVTKRNAPPLIIDTAMEYEL